MHRIVGMLLALALAFGSGCSDSEKSADESSGASTTVQARSLPLVWVDILAQRNRIQAAVAKGTEMWHEDCAEVSSAAAAMDPLAVELGNGIAALKLPEAQRAAIEPMVGFLQSSSAKLRSTAIDEEVGALPGLLIGLDALLQAIEVNLGRDTLGPESVVTRPGFNPVPPPPAPSPI